MNKILIENGNVIRDREIRKSNVLICDKTITDTDFKGEIPHGTLRIDAQGQYVSPGFIDIHVHGGGGFDFMDCTPEAFRKISQIHLLNGTTTMLPTAVSSDNISDIKKLLLTYKVCINHYDIAF